MARSIRLLVSLIGGKCGGLKHYIIILSNRENVKELETSPELKDLFNKMVDFELGKRHNAK